MLQLSSWRGHAFVLCPQLRHIIRQMCTPYKTATILPNLHFELACHTVSFKGCALFQTAPSKQRINYKFFRLQKNKKYSIQRELVKNPFKSFLNPHVNVFHILWGVHYTFSCLSVVFPENQKTCFIWVSLRLGTYFSDFSSRVHHNRYYFFYQ